MRQRLYTATFTPAEEVFIQARIDAAVAAEHQRCTQIADGLRALIRDLEDLRPSPHPVGFDLP